MKKSKIIMCVSMLLLFAVLLSSCGSTKVMPIRNLTKVLNPDYEIDVEPYTFAEEITELKGYTVYGRASDSDDFVVFTKGEAPSITYKVFSYRSNSVILEFTTSKDTVYSFGFLRGKPVIIVKKTVTEESDNLLDPIPKITNTYTLYDATAQAVATSETESMPRTVDDYIVFEDVVYTADDDGKLSKEFDLPEYMDIKNFCGYNDKYFYTSNLIGISVYDREFKRVSAWSLPNYGDESVENLDLHFLDNGDMIAQYTVILDEDADDYDIIEVKNGVTKKLDLVSVLISAKNGRAKDIDLDYIIETVITNDSLYDENKENNRYTDGFHNIAYIKPIVDGKILNSSADKDIVLMDNRGRLTNSLKVVDYQLPDLAKKIADGLYTVTTLDGGVMVIDEKGKIVHAFNNYVFKVVGDYFVSEKAVYDMDLEVVYDLSAKNVEVTNIIGNTIFIKSGDTDEYSIITLRDGEQKTIYTHTSKTKTEFGVLSYFYYIKGEDGYQYFNEKGDCILTTDNMLEYVAESVDHEIVLLTSSEKTTKYYKVNK